LINALTAALFDPDKAVRYGLDGRQSILLSGPPGCGKTLMARIAASEVTRLHGVACPVSVVKPSEWEDPYVGETQRKMRACFASIPEGGVLFLDEVESIGRIRGYSGQHIADKFLAALLAELDGFSRRKGVAVVAATNLKSLLDPALLDRLADLEIAVTRPSMDAARQIFGIHLPASAPYAVNGLSAAEHRDEAVDLGVSLLYSPNADNEICTLRFRDGNARVVFARELVSGRTIEQICKAARRSAFVRDINGGEQGVQAGDVRQATEASIQRMRTTLQPHNVRSYLEGLPQDVDVVAVDPVARTGKRAGRYLVAR
jgi:proteasome-associated ATPase